MVAGRGKKDFRATSHSVESWGTQTIRFSADRKRQPHALEGGHCLHFQERKKAQRLTFWVASCFFPLQRLGTLPRRKSLKNGEKPLSAVRPPKETGKIPPKKGTKYSENTIVASFRQFFSSFGGRSRREKCDFSPFSGIRGKQLASFGSGHAKGWGSKSSCPPSKVCLPWVSKGGTWHITGILPGCPGPLGVFKKFVQQKKFVLIFSAPTLVTHTPEACLS